MSNVSCSGVNHYSIADTLSLFDVFIDKIDSINLVNDSRDIQAGDVFCATVGREQDGRQYIDQAIKNGAVLVLAQCQHTQQHGNIITKHFAKPNGPLTQVNQVNKENLVNQVNGINQEKSNSAHISIQVVQFFNLNQHLFELAKAYYQSPQTKMTMIGITGTNGKTSTSQIIAKLFEACQQTCAVIGTIGSGRLSSLKALNNTTPGATQLHQLLAEFSAENIAQVAMEVSSHALEQGRVTAGLFDLAVFTNLSRDHLDYHQTMENYADAKGMIFRQADEHDTELNPEASKKQIAILNGDDEQVTKWLTDWPADWLDSKNIIVYGRSKAITQYPHYLYASDIKSSARGVSFYLQSHIGNIKVESPLMGDFNVDNLLAAMSVLIAEQYSLKVIVEASKNITPIIGRMESFSATYSTTCSTESSFENSAIAIVDYAHTPDALENALKACRLHCEGQLWLVFGCGGDRDSGKRSMMGSIAEKRADHVIITNDNPRSEIPELIANDILSGFECPEKVAVMLNREQAVISTLSHAKAGDIVLLAGKGHEKFILMANEKIAYNERELVRNFYLKKALS